MTDAELMKLKEEFMESWGNFLALHCDEQALWHWVEKSLNRTASEKQMIIGVEVDKRLRDILVRNISTEVNILYGAVSTVTNYPRLVGELDSLLTQHNSVKESLDDARK